MEALAERRMDVACVQETCQQRHAGSKTLHQQIPPVAKSWRCRVMQVDLDQHNGHKTVVVVVVSI